MSDFLKYVSYQDSTGSLYEIDDSSEITIDMGSERRNNKITLTLKNDPINTFSDGTVQHKWIKSSGDCVFNIVKGTKGELITEELVEVFATYTEDSPDLDVNYSDYLIMNGYISDGEIEWSSDKHTIQLECKDRTTVILDKLCIPQNYQTSNNYTAPKIIQSLLRSSVDYSTPNTTGFDSLGNVGTFYPFLIDARLFSDGIKSSGTPTSTSTLKLIDSTATFISDGVQKGDWIRNTLNNSYAYVVSITSETELEITKDIFTSVLHAYQISDGFIQDTRSDGSAFPIIAYNEVDKTLIKVLEDMSTVDYMNSTAEQASGLIITLSARWFLDRQNRLHWYVPDNTPELVMSLGETTAISPDRNAHKIHNLKAKKSVDNTINYITFKAGSDMNGNMIKSYSRAKFSGSPLIKDSKREWLEIARAMKKQDEDAGHITKISEDEYDYPSSYPMTPSWDRQARSVANSSAYNANFIEEATLRAKAKCSAIFSKLANPRWSGSMQIRGENINVGDLIQLTSKPHGIRNLLVRVNQVTHKINDGGWLTSVKFQEDEVSYTVI